MQTSEHPKGYPGVLWDSVPRHAALAPYPLKNLLSSAP